MGTGMSKYDLKQTDTFHIPVENKEPVISLPIYNPEGGEEQTSLKEEETTSSQVYNVTQESLLQNLQATSGAIDQTKLAFEFVKGKKGWSITFGKD